MQLAIHFIRIPISELASTFAMLVVIAIILAILASAIKIVKEYERAVIFRLGRLLGAKGPGIFFVIPIVDTFKRVDLRVLSFDVPKQRLVTRDNVTCDADAVVLGQVELDDLLTKREELNKRLQEILDAATDPWGIKVVTVAIKDVTLPESMQRAIAKQAEAERERRSRIIMADGEYQAAAKMAEAAKLYAENPIAVKLREFQMLSEVAREKNLIVIAPSTTSEIATTAALVEGMAKKKTRS